MLGELLKELREDKGLLQREVAATLQVDTALISKFEHNEKPLSRAHIITLCKLYEVPEARLQACWLAEKVKRLVRNEKHSEEALKIVLKDLNDTQAV